MLFSWTTRETHQQGAGFTRDIGVDGAFVFAQLCPPAGTQIKVELVLPVPEDPRRELRLRCTGTVVRTEVDWPYGRGFAVSGHFGGELQSEMARA
jgi:hypothetical protein